MKWFNKMFPDEPKQGYQAILYLDEELTIPMFGKLSRDFEEIKKYAVDNCEDGYNCRIYNYEAGTEGIALAKNFDATKEFIVWKPLAEGFRK